MISSWYCSKSLAVLLLFCVNSWAINHKSQVRKSSLRQTNEKLWGLDSVDEVPVSGNQVQTGKVPPDSAAGASKNAPAVNSSPAADAESSDNTATAEEEQEVAENMPSEIYHRYMEECSASQNQARKEESGVITQADDDNNTTSPTDLKDVAKQKRLAMEQVKRQGLYGNLLLENFLVTILFPGVFFDMVFFRSSRFCFSLWFAWLFSVFYFSFYNVSLFFSPLSVSLCVCFLILFCCCFYFPVPSTICPFIF